MPDNVHITHAGARFGSEADYQRFEQDYEHQEQLRLALEKVLGNVFASCGGRGSVNVRLQRLTQNTAYPCPFGIIVRVDGGRISGCDVPRSVTDLYRALKRGFLTTHGIASGLSREGQHFELYASHSSVAKLVKAVDRTIHGMNIAVPHWSCMQPKRGQPLAPLTTMLGTPQMPMREPY